LCAFRKAEVEIVEIEVHFGGLVPCLAVGRAENWFINL
jgi:hypothetical protein